MDERERNKIEGEIIDAILLDELRTFDPAYADAVEELRRDAQRAGDRHDAHMVVELLRNEAP